MQTVSRSSFTTVTTEGAILPADLLQRIVDGRELEGLRPEDYHLAPNERLNEAISRSWNRLLGVWEGFDEQRNNLPEEDRGTTLTRERWLLILLQELGYGRLPFQGSIAIDGEDEESAKYPISHEYDRVLLHLITFRQPLDRADSERAQRFRRSPHSLLQEFLNRSDRHLWGIVSNGLLLRILRDNVSFTRAAYLEFDLEAMMEGEIYADFTLLWLTVHQSRVESPPGGGPETCWLEKWSQEAAEQGTRALDSLRDGVQEAISILGRGFLAHPSNGDLRQQLQSGNLGTQEYYRQLLRLVYRLIFLFVAEDRNLLLVKEAEPEIRTQYHSYYSLTRLRELAARRRSGPHPDLFRSLRLVMVLLREGFPALGLPGLGSYLFSDRSTPSLDEAEIVNEALLDAIRGLAFTVENRVLRPVDYKNLGAEELGSVYESLLELHPELNVAAATFDLKTAAGSERKTTGSYYTPTSLINSLLDTALEPVVADRLRGKKGKEAEDALLSIKVVDPAAGSGHFLIAAANRLARHLARVRTGDEEPSPEANRLALRVVVRQCIHGVDINEMAVELCKVGLWLETLDPGKPLSFLDRNIQCGNSLIGTTPALLDKGIPDEAFTPVTGDDKAYVREFKKLNREQRKGQMALFKGTQPWDRLGNLAVAIQELDEIEDGTVAGVRAQEEAYAELVRSQEYQYGKLWADAWCAAFFWILQPEDKGGFPYPITEEEFRRVEHNPFSIPAWMREEIERISARHQFFHWHLAFPNVFRPPEKGSPYNNDITGWEGGFDVVLGNPPWERIKLQEKEWFASKRPEIASAGRASDRRKLIASLQDNDPDLFAAFMNDKQAVENESIFYRKSGRYPLSAVGDINTYQLFAGLVRYITLGTGRVGIIIPSGIATDYYNQEYFNKIIQNRELFCLYDFENRDALFPEVHRSYKFCLLTLSGLRAPVIGGADFVFFAHQISDVGDERRRFRLTFDDIARINPNTFTCPVFHNRKDAELSKNVYERVPILMKETEPQHNSWRLSFLRMFDMTNDAALFRTAEELESESWQRKGNFYCKGEKLCLPMWEDWMIHHYEHRYQSNGGLETTLAEHQDPYFSVLPRYWVDKRHVDDRAPEVVRAGFAIGFRNRTRSTDRRTVISSIIPLSAVGNTLPLLLIKRPKLRIVINANLSSFVLDYVAGRKIGGLNLNFYIVKQLPVIPPDTYATHAKWSQGEILGNYVLSRVLELAFTAYDLLSFAQEVGYHGPSFHWDDERRFLICCELDAAYFHLYGIERDDVDYIMDTFPIVRRKDEDEFSEYRTKRVILEIYDEMAEAMATSQPYQTRLNPPPAHPDAAHPWDEEFLGPELSRDQWWQEVELPEPVEGEEPKTTFASPPAKSTFKEPSPAFELKSPPSKQAQPRTKPAQDELAQPAQQALVTDFTPLQGSRSQRLKQVMDLGKKQTTANIQQLVGALADEDSNIRWLAGSTLVKFGGRNEVEMLRTYLDQEPDDEGRKEAVRVLGLIAETAEDEEVREAARRLRSQPET